jgi:predicted nuclease of predicted toxin-antitoxin system
MRFLCDVHISYKLVNYLTQAGHEAIHVNTILDKWFSKDAEIASYADDNDCIVITKDADFRDSHFLKKSPKRLIKINLGNISNNELIVLFDNLLNEMDKLNTSTPFLIELDRDLINYTSI